VATDPVTGIDVDPDVVRTLDYLGRRSPVFSSGQAALPGVGGPTPSSGPSGPGGAGATTAPAGEAVASSVGGAPAGPDNAATILNLVGQGIGGAKTVTQTAKDIVGGEAPSSRVPVGSELDKLEMGGFGEGGAAGILAPSGVFKDVKPSGPVDSETGGPTGGLLDLAGAGLSTASLAALIAQLVESGKISPGQAVGLLQSTGGTASGLAATLGPAKAGEAGTLLSGTLGSEAAGLLGTAGSVIGGAGAVGSVALSLKNEFDALRAARDDPRMYASAGGSELGLAAGGIIGSIISPGYGTLIGLGAGGAAGTAIGNAIAKNLPQTHYMAQREHWGEVATDAVNAYGFGIQKAAQNGGLPEIQAALGQGYADGHVRAFLGLPDFVAAAIGIPSTVGFEQLTTPQFLTVLKAASQTDPAEWQRWITAQGDVQFLDQGRAQGVSDATRDTAAATVSALIEAYRPVLDQMPAVAPEAIEASRAWAAGAPERDTFWSQPFRGATEGSGE
jgi:hypothetical protein